MTMQKKSPMPEAFNRSKAELNSYKIGERCLIESLTDDELRFFNELN